MKTGPVLSHRASRTSNRPRDRCEPCGISYCICLARYLPDDYSIARVVKKVLVTALKVICKAKDLKTIVSTDDPKVLSTCRRDSQENSSRQRESRQSNVVADQIAGCRPTISRHCVKRRRMISR